MTINNGNLRFDITEVNSAGGPECICELSMHQPEAITLDIPWLPVGHSHSRGNVSVDVTITPHVNGVYRRPRAYLE